MSIEFRIKNPVWTSSYQDGETIENIVIRTSDLPLGTDTDQLGIYDPKDGKGYQANLNINVASGAIVVWPAKAKGDVQYAVEIPHTRFPNGIPARTVDNGTLEGTIFPTTTKILPKKQRI